jgi:predicted deacetylase
LLEIPFIQPTQRHQFTIALVAHQLDTTHQGQQDAYSINFNTAGTVENKSFSTCAQAGLQNTRKALDNMGGAGGAGY